MNSELILTHKDFKALSNIELYQALQLRSEIFVVEQNCAYQDLDGKDESAIHVLAYYKKQLVAYARILKPGISYKEAAIGRVVVSKNVRGKNFGKELMNYCIQLTLKEYSTNEIVISAQKYLEKFYSDLKFVQEGEEYLEDNIPHIKMRYSIA